MSYEQYWDGDCTFVRYYREAYELKKKEQNQEMWMQGLYFKKALTSSLSEIFRGKGEKPIPYDSEPLPLSQKEINERAERDERERYEAMKRRMHEEVLRAKNRKKEDKGNAG